MFSGSFWSWVQRSHSQINKIKHIQYFQNYEYFCQAQPMYEKYVENFFTILLHNFPCVYTTDVEGPTIPNNLNSDKISSNCAADYFEIFLFNYSPCSVRKFVDINSYILCWNICVTLYGYDHTWPNMTIYNYTGTEKGQKNRQTQRVRHKVSLW